MKICSVVPENGCLVFLWRTEKKTEKNICKTHTHPPHQRLRKTGVDVVNCRTFKTNYLNKYAVEVWRPVTVSVTAQPHTLLQLRHTVHLYHTMSHSNYIIKGAQGMQISAKWNLGSHMTGHAPFSEILSGQLDCLWEHQHASQDLKSKSIPLTVCWSN